MASSVDHPPHYGGDDNPYEVIKVIEAWGLGFNLGNVVKYIGRPTKGNYLEDLKKARWYLDRAIKNFEAGQDASKPLPLVTVAEHNHQVWDKCNSATCPAFLTPTATKHRFPG